MEKEKVGPYTILENLGTGGMGEVFLAQDPNCDRNVALKRIKPDLKNNPTVRGRFLREAQVASLLTHPSIIPILSIETHLPDDTYYTMPYIEGKTLRQVLKETKQEKNIPQEKSAPSISSLARIFLQVCEAMAYTHSKGILHRDLKPENIMIGKFGEVMIFDWGIADFIQDILEEEPIPLKSADQNLTRPGKVAGTIAYMAPERLSGKSSSPQTDIYALGVILYQMLTLELPFQRKSLSAFRKQVHIEEVLDPLEMAPYRDIPHELAFVAQKCLARKEEDRYLNMHELILDVKSFVEGLPQWVCLGHLSKEQKEDWQIQENVLLAKRSALTSSLDTTEWAAMLISKRSFTENLRLDTEVKIQEDSEGVGILFNLPLSDGKKTLEEGYCLWLGSKVRPGVRLFRNHVQVMEIANLSFNGEKWHQIRLEKVEDRLRFFLDGALILSFTSYLPLAGTHVGLLFKDGLFDLKEISLYDGSRNVLVNCLAVPNAFLSHKFYDLALQEYRRIAQCFPGRLEGREALFRAGLTLLEHAKKTQEAPLFHAALQEFEHLKKTPGAPLEYLGKSLVYQAMLDFEEEAKCLELLLRKYPKHPLLCICKEHIIYRLHETAIHNRDATYRISLLALRHIPELLDRKGNQILIDTLQESWETLPFIEENADRVNLLAVQLAFWLNKVPILCEMAGKLEEESPLKKTILYCLLELGAHKELSNYLEKETTSSFALEPNKLIEKPNEHLFYYWMKEALTKKDFVLFRKFSAKTNLFPEKTRFDALEIWSYLLQRKLPEASALLRKYHKEELEKETSPLYFAFGTWLYLMQGAPTALDHFSSVLDTPYPPTTALAPLFVAGKIPSKKEWEKKAFLFEKKELYRLLDWFYQAIGT